jgi:DNA-binding NtrC family response regulator
MEETVRLNVGNQDKNNHGDGSHSLFYMANELVDIMNDSEKQDIIVTKNRKSMADAQEMLVYSYILLNLSQQKIPLKDFLRNLEEKLIGVVLLVTKGSLKQSAEILGIKKTTLSEKIKRYNIDKKVNILNLLQQEKNQK